MPFLPPPKDVQDESEEDGKDQWIATSRARSRWKPVHVSARGYAKEMVKMV